MIEAAQQAGEAAVDVGAKERIAVCIATFRRPELLARLLVSIRGLELPPGVEIEVRIVDNDASGSAESTIERFSDLDPRYAVEPERNIALARNRALEFGRADFVAFIDDDEAARPGWLAELHDRIRRTGADAVFGPVHACFPAGAPRWAAREGLLEKPVDAQRELPWTATRTSNALVTGRWFFDEGFRFDPEFGRSGGEDTDLFRRMQARGARFIAAARAVVDEDVHPEQCTLGWFVRRHLRGGANFERQTGSWPPIVLARFCKRLIGGTLRTLLGMPLWACGNPGPSYRGICELARAAGGLIGWVRPSVFAQGPGYTSSGTEPS